MLAVGFERFGGPEVMTLLTLPEPHVGPGQVRIKVEAADINIADADARSGAIARQLPQWYPVHTGPYVVGWDAAGVIDEVGPGVEGRLLCGDAVIALVHPRLACGAQAEFVIADAASVVHAPRGKTPVAAATLLMNALTARAALDSLRVGEGSIIAVTGAAGAVGGFAVELAKAAGIRVIADATPDDRELVTALGADMIVERGPGLARAILAAAGPVDGVIDTAMLDDAITPAVVPGGSIFSACGFTGRPGDGIRWTYRPEYELLSATAELEKLRDAAERDELTLRVAATCLPGQASDAHRQIEAGGTGGRLVFIF
ncbi:NADP-dependent oxidoreductase [Nocardia sp. NPDC005978]|uniref:NADP-dependent oxidoreductase n=1 Tax=Nocardia sp. NPDC005978 TaxID=3156725 RepID=UPI0033B1EDF6